MRWSYRGYLIHAHAPQIPINHLLLRDERVRSFFEGKTIAKLEGPAVNVVTFHFTDGTKIAVEVDSMGNGRMVACQPCVAPAEVLVAERRSR